jgi:hypothetical protein
MLEVVGTVVGIEEDFSKPVTHTIKLCNVKVIQGDQCAGENRQILFLSKEESHRLAAIMPEGYMEGEREFIFRTYADEDDEADWGILYCKEKIAGLTHDDDDDRVGEEPLYLVCETVRPEGAKKLAYLLGGTIVEDPDFPGLPEMVLEGDWVEGQDERYDPFPSGYIPRDDFEDSWKKVKGRDICFRAYLCPGEEERGRRDALEQKDIFLRKGADSVRIEIIEPVIHTTKPPAS